MRKIIFSIGFLFVLLVSLTVSQAFAAENIQLKLKGSSISEVALMFADILETPIFVAQDLTQTVTVVHPSLPVNEAESFLKQIIVQTGLQFYRKDGAIYINKPGFSVDGLHKGSLAAGDVNLSTKIYRLNTLAVNDAKSIINSLLKSTESQVSFVDSAPSTSVDTLPDQAGLIVTALDFQHVLIEDLLPGIDIPEQQIKIDAIVYETLIGDSQSLGMKLALNESKNKVTFGTGLVATNSLGLFVDLGITDTFRSLFSALNTEASTRVLTKPSISLLNGEEGFITVGQNIPVISTKQQNDDGDNNTISIERMDIGVSLKVSAFILPSGLIKLVVDQQDSSIAKSEVPASDLITNKRQMTSTLLLRNGRYKSLGGLIKTFNLSSGSGVPFLSDIPLLGDVFTYNKKTERNTMLNVILKATIEEV